MKMGFFANLQQKNLKRQVLLAQSVVYIGTQQERQSILWFTRRNTGRHSLPSNDITDKSGLSS